jgi:hypothetical protein
MVGPYSMWICLKIVDILPILTFFFISREKKFSYNRIEIEEICFKLVK